MAPEIFTAGLWLLTVLFAFFTLAIIILVLGMEFLTRVLRAMAARLEDAAQSITRSAERVREATRVQDEIAARHVSNDR